MKRAPCDRRWQVEAARDGRLDGSERAAFEQHVADCAVCLHERESLDALARSLRQLGGELDEMALRRLRQQTLEKANDSIVEAPRASPGRAVAWTVLACSAVAAAVLLVMQPAPSDEAVATSSVTVVPEHDARWQRNLERDIERVDLSSGTLLFRVARGPHDRRLIVHVPDGEIEDLGTVFSVSVQDGKTREISVREGRVLFHRSGASALHLVAGSTWTPPIEAASAAAAPVVPAVVLPAPAALEDVRGGSRAMDKPKGPERRSHVSAQAPSPAPAQAMPTQETPGEDAAYLQVLALLREGRVDEARLAAFAYLKAYPSGFRRVEVSRVANARGAHTPARTSEPINAGDGDEPSE